MQQTIAETPTLFGERSSQTGLKRRCQQPHCQQQLVTAQALEDGTGQPGDVAEFLGESDERGSGF